MPIAIRHHTHGSDACFHTRSASPNRMTGRLWDARAAHNYPRTCLQDHLRLIQVCTKPTGAHRPLMPGLAQWWCVTACVQSSSLLALLSIARAQLGEHGGELLHLGFHVVGCAHILLLAFHGVAPPDDVEVLECEGGVPACVLIGRLGQLLQHLVHAAVNDLLGATVVLAQVVDARKGVVLVFKLRVRGLWVLLGGLRQHNVLEEELKAAPINDELRVDARDVHEGGQDEGRNLLV
mmetsp:Transcript_16988/g.45808  ORF Transcript_16988/g.45808 Transcript_16988/m.45808 type:complete len:236 (-) Transcript_16988:300-1007(-)